MCPLLCIQCSLKAFVEDKPAPVFEESPEAHRARVHPDPVATQLEREELERLMSEKLRSSNP